MGLVVSGSTGKIIKAGITAPLNEATLTSSGTFAIEKGGGAGSNGIDFSYGEKSDNFSLFDFLIKLGNSEIRKNKVLKNQ